MARKYREVEQLVEIIQQRHENGETYREIGASFGLTREEVRGAVKRQQKKRNRKSVAGICGDRRDVHAKAQQTKTQNATAKLHICG